MQQRAAGGRRGRHLESATQITKTTLSIDEYLLEEKSCQFSNPI